MVLTEVNPLLSQAVTDIGLGLAGAEPPAGEGDEGGGFFDPWTVGVLAAIAGALGWSCYASHRRDRHYRRAARLRIPCLDIWAYGSVAAGASAQVAGCCFLRCCHRSHALPQACQISLSIRHHNVCSNVCVLSGCAKCCVLFIPSGLARQSVSCATTTPGNVSQAVPDPAEQDQARTGGGACRPPVHELLLPHLSGGLLAGQRARAGAAGTRETQQPQRSGQHQCRSQRQRRQRWAVLLNRPLPAVLYVRIADCADLTLRSSSIQPSTYCRTQAHRDCGSGAPRRSSSRGRGLAAVARASGGSDSEGAGSREGCRDGRWRHDGAGEETAGAAVWAPLLRALHIEASITCCPLTSVEVHPKSVYTGLHADRNQTADTTMFAPRLPANITAWPALMAPAPAAFPCEPARSRACKPRQRHTASGLPTVDR